MKYQKFENNLSDLFDGATTTVDMAALMEGIHPEPNSNRKGLFLLAFFALLCTAGVLGVHSIITNNHSSQLTSVAADIDEAHSEVAKTHVGGKSSAAGIVEQSEQLLPMPNSSNSKSSSIPTTDEPKTIPNTDTKTLNTSKENTTLKAPAVELPLQKASVISVREETTSISNPTATTKATELIKSAIAPTASITAVPALTDNEINLLDFKRVLPTKDDVKCPSFSKSNSWHFDLIPEVGYIVPFKTLSNNNSEPNNVFDRRAADENTLEGVQAALYARVRRGASPFYLKFGLSYTRVSERMDLTTSYDSISTEIGIISITESQNGDTLTVITGPIETVSTITKSSRDHYYLSLLDIPAAAGYSQSIGGGWRLGAEVGAQFNISVSTSGRLLESLGANSYVELPADGRFNPSLGISLFGGITLERAISARSSFYLSPRFRYFPDNFTPGSYNVQQAYQFAGIHAGYVYSF